MRLGTSANIAGGDENSDNASKRLDVTGARIRPPKYKNSAHNIKSKRILFQTKRIHIAMLEGIKRVQTLPPQ